jgi:hypothetical protein
VTATDWYWCLTHGRAEAGSDRDDPDNSLGPYPTEAAAADWKSRNAERDEAWKAQDEEWTGEADDDDDPTTSAGDADG